MEREPRTIAVTGVSGVGKDFLIKEALTDLSNARVYSTNRALADMLSERGLSVADLGSSEAIESAARQSNQRIVDSIHDNPSDQNVINTHITHERPEGLTTDYETLEQIAPRDIVVVTADPEAIAARRQNDTSRRRLVEQPHIIAEKQDEEIKGAEEVARTIGAKTTIITNSDDSVEENARKISKLIQSPFGENSPKIARGTTKESLLPFLIKNPDSRVDMSGFNFGALERFEAELLNGVDFTDSEIGIASQIYNRFLAKIGFSEEAYLGFNDADERERVFTAHLAGNINNNEARQLYTCNEAAIEIAKLLHAGLGKVGYLENYAQRGIEEIPHTAYVVMLGGSDGRKSEFVFDPFATFAYSDALLSQSGSAVDISSNLKMNRQMVDEWVEGIVADCGSYADVLTSIEREILDGKYRPVEQTSLIKNIINAYKQKTGRKALYDRFRINEARQIACVIQFPEEDGAGGFLISHGYIGGFSNEELLKMEENGVLSHISMVRHINFTSNCNDL